MRFLQWLLPIAMRLLYKSLRKQVTGVEKVSKTSKSAVIAAFWHGKMLTGWLAAQSLLRELGSTASVSAVVSLSKDGDILANALARLGFQLIRGSSSRGKAEVKAEISSALTRHAHIVLTPDGPRGPKESLKYGSIRLASEHGAAFWFLKIHHRNAWRLKSWDGFEIPKPFSTVEIDVKPISLPTFESEDVLRVFTENLSSDLSSTGHCNSVARSS